MAEHQEADQSIFPRDYRGHDPDQWHTQPDSSHCSVPVLIGRLDIRYKQEYAGKLCAEALVNADEK